MGPGGGACVDFSTNCAGWGRQGLCNSNQAYMWENCKQTCGWNVLPDELEHSASTDAGSLVAFYELDFRRRTQQGMNSRHHLLANQRSCPEPPALGHQTRGNPCPHQLVMLHRK
ncbi:shTK domain protein, partial [Ostertagia ostertagi]